MLNFSLKWPGWVGEWFSRGEPGDLGEFIELSLKSESDLFFILPGDLCY